MKELSLHILDIAENSVVALSKNIEIKIIEDINNNLFLFSIKDDGKGMDEEFISNVFNPFTTTRTTRKVGLGLPLLLEAAKRCGGDLKINSKVGLGTTVTASFQYNSIDRQPLGDIVSTIVTLVSCNPDINFVYSHKINNNEFSFDTLKIKEILGDVPLNNIEVVTWMKEYLNQELLKISGGVL